jgi:hypothetical protein
MKIVLLSADNNPSVYTVPDCVADNLRGYCMEFDNWLWQSPHAERFRTCKGVRYNEKDFIDYLNIWVFPEEQSKLIETLDRIDAPSDIPERYKGCERFNF